MMRALALDDTGVALRTDYPEPSPCEGDVLVRVLRAGICETDLQLIRGYLGFRGVLGHEFVGVAEDGVFADRIAVPQRNLHVVPDAVDTDVAVFTEPVAAAFQIPAQLTVERDDRVVVLGDGRLRRLRRSGAAACGCGR